MLLQNQSEKIDKVADGVVRVDQTVNNVADTLNRFIAYVGESFGHVNDSIRRLEDRQTRFDLALCRVHWRD
jgi:methyl-accepting chemotaxis protein